MRFPTIPQDEQVGLVRLATLTDDQIEQLRSALTDAPVFLSREAFIRGVPAVEGVVPEALERSSGPWPTSTDFLLQATTNSRSLSEMFETPSPIEEFQAR